MSTGLAALAGVGQGLMQGSQIVHHQNMQNARLGMLEEQHDWKRQQHEQQQAEQQRVAQMAQLHRQAWQEAGPEADPLQVSANVFKRVVQSGIAQPQELEQLFGQVRELRKRNILSAVRMGDMNALSGAFSKQMGRKVQVRPGMGDDGFGGQAPVYSIVDQDGSTLQQLTTPQVGTLLGVDDLINEEEQRLEMAGKRATIDKDRASAAKYRTDAAKTSADSRHNELVRTGHAMLAEGRQPNTDTERRALAAARADTRGATPSTFEKEARFLVQIGAAPDLATAANAIRTDERLRSVLWMAARDTNSFTDLEGAVTRYSSMFDDLVNRPPQRPAETDQPSPVPHVRSNATQDGHPVSDDQADIDLMQFMRGGR